MIYYPLICVIPYAQKIDPNFGYDQKQIECVKNHISTKNGALVTKKWIFLNIYQSNLMGTNYFEVIIQDFENSIWEIDLKSG